jgi:nitroreductase
MTKASEADLDLLFRNARTHNGWQDKPVEESLLEQIHDICKWGPTSANTCPLRIVFVKSAEAKEKLKPCLAPGNVEKTMAAPVTAIFASDMEFYEKMNTLSPHNPKVREWFAGNDAKIAETAFRNGTLQAAYFMIAARAMGLDCGPMSGFDNAKVDEAFFKNTPIKSNFICSLGYGEPSKLHQRAPRFAFSEACKIV